MILNVAGYAFVELDALDSLRVRLRDRAHGLGLRGTVLLAEEGVNLVLAGQPDSVRLWLRDLRSVDCLSTFAVKESWSETVPFKRLKVKVKREIIRMNHPAVKPMHGRAESVNPATLKRWLDQRHDDDGRPVVLLDTRNQFEVECGTFKGARSFEIAKFTEFPARAVRHRDDFANQRVVSFCTGGIRCEKAAIFMREAGIENVVQLEGGILKYFEEVGQDHFTGTCFVFDERASLTGDLVPASPE